MMAGEGRPTVDENSAGTTPEPMVLPQPGEIPAAERDDALGAYLMMFASLAVGLPLPFLNLIASFIYYSINKKRSAFVAFHALQALLAHLPVAIGNAGAVVGFIFILIGRRAAPGAFWIFLVALVVLNILYLVYSIIAMLRAAKGRFYYIPLAGRAAFSFWFGEGADSRRRRAEERSARGRDDGNLPPRGLGGGRPLG